MLLPHYGGARGRLKGKQQKSAVGRGKQKKRRERKAMDKVVVVVDRQWLNSQMEDHEKGWWWIQLFSSKGKKIRGRNGADPLRFPLPVK